MKYYKELDSVRGIAAVMVMFFHFFRAEGLPQNSLIPILTKTTILGQTGVTLFFVLSGFLITRILIANKNRNNYFSSFYARRSLRIFPLYYFYLCLYYFIIPIINGIKLIPINQSIYHWIYLQNFAYTFHWPIKGPTHFWSLAVEEHFYLFWPVLIYFLTRRKIFTACIIIILLALITRIILIKTGCDSFYFTFSNIDSLAIGAILAVFEPNLKGKILGVSMKKIFLIFLSIILLPTVFLWLLAGGERNITIQIFKPILLSLIYFSLIGYIVSASSNTFIKILRNKALNFIGKISYGLYVYHPICFSIFLMSFRIPNLWISLIINFSIAIIVATISFYVFEKRFLNLKKYFVAKSVNILN